ncbi:MAG: M23 family metallopeptidase [SAR324 cluster bacterium]|nr:M23 family metallopeptidase [SAR324 cluster bacterium]
MPAPQLSKTFQKIFHRSLSPLASFHPFILAHDDFLIGKFVKSILKSGIKVGFLVLLVLMLSNCSENEDRNYFQSQDVISKNLVFQNKTKYSRKFSTALTFKHPFPSANTPTQNYNNGRNHPGVDYAGGDHKILSTAFGKITNIDESNENYNRTVTITANSIICTPNWSGYNYVYIEHLMQNGNLVYSKYLHFPKDSIQPNINEFVVGGQYLGTEGRSGCVSGTHLHFELGKTEGAQPYSNVGMNNTYNPENYINTQEILVPDIGGKHGVYAVVGEQVMGNLSIQGNFPQSGILVRKSANRSDATNQEKSATPKFLAESKYSSVNEISGNTDQYKVGSYLFLAFIDPATGDNRYGYPIQMDVVYQNQLIVDNDQLRASEQTHLNTNERTDFCSSFTSPCDNPYSPPLNPNDTVPGYYLTAYVAAKNSKAIAQWNPNRRGKFTLQVFVPEWNAGASQKATKVTYRIMARDSNGTQTPYISDPIDHSCSGWKPLTVTLNGVTEDKTCSGESQLTLNGTRVEEFLFYPGDYVELILNDSEISTVGIDAIKFAGGEKQSSEIQTGLGTVGDSGLAWLYVARLVYQNFMTKAPGPVKVIVKTASGTTSNKFITVVHDEQKQSSVYTLFPKKVEISWKTGAIISSGNSSSRCGAVSYQKEEGMEPAHSKMMAKKNLSVCK